uniref:Pyruvate phosphate dikinase AMP/ATP-binding domain-containing protein n=1 Tax=Physcomitrium patens TaxID=3218 RepID=A0A7I4E2F3_PHYPA
MPIEALLMKTRVFSFRKGRSQGNMGMKSVMLLLAARLSENTTSHLGLDGQLGGKGANFAEMSSIGLSVPPGLTVTTETCEEYNSNGSQPLNSLWEEVLGGLRTIEIDMGAMLGDPSKPLLVSVHCGAASVEPGIDDEVVIGLAARNRERFAYDSYQRFIDMIWRCGDGSIAFVLRARAGKS